MDVTDRKRTTALPYWKPIALGAAVMSVSGSAGAQEQGTGPGAVEEVTFLEMFFLSGDWVGLAIIWLLLLLSVFTIGYTMMLALQYRRGTLVPEHTRRRLSHLILDGRYGQAITRAQKDGSYLARVTAAALTESTHGYAAMERALEESSEAETTRILRSVEHLNVVGNIAPMIGLFGTVYGMIVAFQRLVAAGGSPDPAELAAGISTALVTTFWGLVVAIPALAAYALLRNQIDALTSEGLLVAEELIERFKPAGSHPLPPPANQEATNSAVGNRVEA